VAIYADTREVQEDLEAAIEGLGNNHERRIAYPE